MDPLLLALAADGELHASTQLLVAHEVGDESAAVEVAAAVDVDDQVANLELLLPLLVLCPCAVPVVSLRLSLLLSLFFLDAPDNG